MSYDRTISEVRRISAGGLPKKIRRGKTAFCNAERLGWKANAVVLRLLEKKEGSL